MVVIAELDMVAFASESPTSMNPPPELADTDDRLAIATESTSMSPSMPVARSVPLTVVETATVLYARDVELRTEMAPTPKPDEAAVEMPSPELPRKDDGPPTPAKRPSPDDVRSSTRRWFVVVIAPVNPTTSTSLCGPTMEAVPSVQ